MAAILVIDDSRVALASVSHTLRAQAHTVFTAASGTVALTILKQQSLDLVITDIYMPPPDGIEMLLRARAQKILVPFIVMSAHPGPLNLFLPARALGARVALQKPFTPAQLLAAVAQVLGTPSGASVGASPSLP